MARERDGIPSQCLHPSVDLMEFVKFHAICISAESSLRVINAVGKGIERESLGEEGEVGDLHN